MRRNRLSLILVLGSLALSILAASQAAMPVNAVTNNSHMIANTGDHYVFESSYQTHGFYAQGRYWVFYEDTRSSCEGFQGCFFFTSSADGVNFASPTQVGAIHVTDSDWSTATNGTHVFYTRYPEDTFQTTTNKPLLFGVGQLSGAGTINWSPEQIVRSASSSLEFPNEAIGVDSKGQVWIGYQENNKTSGNEFPHIIHSNNALSPTPLSSSFTASPTNTTTTQSVQFTATTSGGKTPYNFSWNFGDGTPTGNGATLSHLFTLPGNYNVTLTTTDSNSPSQAIISTQTISVAPVLASNETPPSIQVPLSISVNSGTQVSFTITAQDPDKEPITLSKSPDTTGASFDPLTGQFTWTPTASQAGRLWTFSFNATDSSGLYATQQVLVSVSPLWSGDFLLSKSGFSGNWHVDIATLAGGGQIYAAYWAEGNPMFGRLYDGSNWAGEETISDPNIAADVNSFVFSPGDNMSAIYYDTNSEKLFFSSRGPNGGWGPDVIDFVGSTSAKNIGRYSLPFTATFDQADHQWYVFWYNQTDNSIAQWSGQYARWVKTEIAFNTKPSIFESPIGSYHYSSSVNGKNTFAIMWIDGTSSPFNLNFALETVGSPSTPTTDASWNPKVGCTAQIVTIEQILGNQSNINGGASESGSIFNPGIRAPSPGDAKRWLTPGNTPAGWFSPGPPCVVTNADGQVVSAFVEVRGVQRGFLLNEDFSANFDPVNGGTPYPNVGYPCCGDTTFNIFTSGFNDASGHGCLVNATFTNTSGCMHTMHLEFDHDWKAAGYCGPNTTCDPYQLAAQTGAGKTLIDFQGFIYWDPDHAGESAHSFSGWELHPLTAWRISGVAPSFTLSANPTSQTILPGGSGNYTITVNTNNLFSGPVPLTAIVTPAGSASPRATLTPSTVVTVPCNQCGLATSTLTVNAMPNSTGPYIITVTGHNGTGIARSVNVTALVEGFSISSNPQSLSVPAGSSRTSIIAITSISGFNNLVSVRQTSSGCGCFLVSLNSSSVFLPSGGTRYVALTVSASSQSIGNELIAITANSTNPSFTATTSVAVTSVDFSATADKTSLTVSAGASNQTSIKLTSSNGFSGVVSLKATSTPSGLTTLLNATTITLQPGGTAFAQLSVNGTQPGIYTVTVNATSGSLIHIVTITVNIVDFSITPIPPIQVNIGSTNTSTISLTSLGGFSGTVNLTNSTSPSGLRVSISSRIITLTSGGTSTATLTILSNTVANYTLTITGSSGSLAHTIQITIRIVDFSISASLVAPASVNAGSTGTSILSLSSINGFVGPVSLTFNAPAGITCSLSATKISFPPSPTTASLSCSSTIANDYSVTVTGANGTLTHTTASILFHVVDFTVTSLPSSTLSLNVGQSSSTISIHVASVHGFAGSVTLAVAVSPFGPSSNPAQNLLKITTFGCACNSTVLNINAGQIAGVFSLNVTVTNGSLTHFTIITLTVNPDNPTLTTSLSPTSIIVGASATDSATLTGASSSAGGSVTYYIFDNGACGAPGTIVSVGSVFNGIVANSRSVVFNSTGTYSFNATYSGDLGNNKASSSCEPITVNSTSTLTAVTCGSSVTVGVPTTCTVTVSDISPGTLTPTGTITLSSNSTLDTIVGPCQLSGSAASASCSFTFTANGLGHHNVTATYPGDSTHLTSSGFVILTPGQHPTTTTVSCTSPVLVGQPSTCRATVADTSSIAPTIPSGTVSFTHTGITGSFNVTSCTLISGTGPTSSCSVTFTGSASGSAGVIGTFSGDSTHAESSNGSSPTPITVNPALVINTPIATPAVIDSGQSSGLSASFTGGTPTFTCQWLQKAPGASVFTNLGSSSTCTAPASVTIPSLTTVGTWSFELQVSDSSASPTTVTSSVATVTVNPAITTPSISATPVALDSGQSSNLATTVSFTGGTAPYSCQWLRKGPTDAAYSNLGAAIPCNQGDTPLTITGPLGSTGTWSFELQVTDSGTPSEIVASSVATVTVNPALASPTISVNPTTIDSGQTAALTTTVSFSGGTSTYTCHWLQKMPGASSYTALSAPITCKPGDLPSTPTGSLVVTGSWLFQLQVNDSGTPIESAPSNSVSVVVSGPLSAGAITPASPTIDSGQSILLASNASGGNTPYTYQWYSDAICNTAIASATSPTYTATPTTNTSYSYKVTDASSSSQCSTGDSVTVNPALLVGAVAPVSPNINSGQDIVLTANPSGGTVPYQYHWKSGSSATCSLDTTLLGSLASQSVTPSANTYYCYTVTDSAFVQVTQSSPTDLVTVHSVLVAGAITPPSPTIDSGQSVTLTANPTGGTIPYSFQWYSGTSPNCSSDLSKVGTSQTETVSPTVSTYYCYIVTDASQGLPTANATSSTNLVTVNSILSIPTITVTSPIDSGQSTTIVVSWTGGTSPYSVSLYTSTSPSTCTGTSQVGHDNGITGVTTTFTQSPTSTAYFCASVTDSSPSATQTSTPSTVVVNPQPIVNTPSATPSTINTGQSSNLSDSFIGGTGPFTCQWLQEAPGASTFSPLAPSSSCTSPSSMSTGTLTNVGSWSFELRLTDSGSPSVVVTSSAVVVTVNGALTAGAISPASPAIDSGQTITLSSNVLGGTSPYSYQWYSDGSCTTSIPSATSTTYSASPTATTIYSYRVTDSASTSQCSPSDTLNVNQPLVAGGVIPTSPSIDKGQSITLAANPSGGTGPYQYHWYSTASSSCPAGSIIGTSASIIVSPSSNTYYCYTVTDSSAGTPLVSATSPADLVTVNSALVAGPISPTNPAIDSGQSVILASNPSGGTASYHYAWFSDGTCSTPIPSATGSSYSASPTITSTYSYKVTDSANTPASICSIGNTVTVNPAVIAGAITPSNPTIDNGQSIVLTAHASQGTSPLSYQWYSDGVCTTPIISGTATTLTASPTTSTIFSYKATDSSNTPASACSPADTVNVNPTLVAGQITPSSPTIDAGQSITLTSHSTGGTPSISYQWFADGTCSLPISGATSPTYTTNPSVKTTYSYSVTDSAFSSVSQCSPGDTISVSTALVAGAIIPSGPTIDTGQSVTLSANPSGGTAPYSFQWFSAGNCVGPITGGTSSTYIASPSSTSTYSYKISDSSQGTPLPSACSPSDTVTVNGPMSAGPIAPASPSIDTGQSITLTANPTGGTLPYSYQWYSDAACSTAISSATQSTYTASPTVASSYSYKVTDSTSATACSAGDTVTVNTALVAGAITPTSPSIDAGQTITLTSSPAGGTSPYSYQWYTAANCITANLIAGATASSHIFSPTATASYSYKVSDSSQGTPSAQTCSLADTVTVNLPLNAGAISPSSPTIDSGQSISLASTASGGTSPYSYQWFADGACTTTIPAATSATYLTSPTVSTTYSYKVTDSANTPFSRCSTGDTVTVSSALVAGTISPNGPTIDSGQSITLTPAASGGTGPYSYQWFSGPSPTCSADTTLLGTSSSQSVSPTSNTYYCYSVSDSAFTHASQLSTTDLVNVSPALAAGPITPSGPTIDQGQSVKLTANPLGGTTPYFYQWYSGTSSTCSSDTAPLGTSQTQTVSSSLTAYYCYKITDSASGSPPATVPSQTDLVTVNPVLGPPSVTASSPIDSGQSTSISATWTGGTSPYTITLYTTSTTTCTALTQVAQNTGVTTQTSSFTQSPTSATSYCISISDSAATPATTQTTSPQTVTVNPVLIVNPSSANPSIVDLSQTSSLSATFQGGTSPYVCQWLEKAPGSNTFSNLGSSSTCSQSSSISTGSLSGIGSWSFELQVTDNASPSAIVVSTPALVTVNPALTAPAISVGSNPIDSGYNSTVSTATSFTGGTAPYTCQWLRKGPLDSGYGLLGSPFACVVGDKPTTSTGILTTAGTWSFELEVGDSGSPSQVKVSAPATVTVIGALSAGAISPGAPMLDSGQSVTLVANAAGGQSPYSYQWYSDGSCTTSIASAKSSSYLASPTITTTYSYKVTDKASVSQCSPADLVTVNSILTAGPISPTSPTIDSGQSVSLSAAVTGGTAPYTYQWFSDPSCTTTISGATNSVYVASPSATTTYTFKVGDASQGTPQATQCSLGDTVSVNPNLVAGPATPSNPTIDNGQSILLASHATGGTSPISYQWFTDGACGSLIPGATSTTFNAAPISTTTYSYKVTDSASSPETQCSPGDTITVVSALSAGSISPSAPSIDNGQSITLTANPSGGSIPYSYQWYSGASPTCASDTTVLGTTPTQTVSPSSNTYYCYSVTDSASAVQLSSTDLVTVNSPLVAGSVTPASPVIDNGESITLVANPIGGTLPYHYQWYSSLTSTCPSGVSIGSTSTLTVSPTSTEHYCYSVTDSSTGSPSVLATSAEVTVSVNPALTAGAVSPASPTIDNGQSITLNASPSGGTTPYHYQWVSGASPTCASDTTVLGTSASQTTSPTSSTYYCYILTDSSIGTPAASTASVTDFVIVSPTLVAGAISPTTPAIDLGQTVTLTANPTGGTAPIFYQWYSDATCSSNIPSANQPTYTASPTSTSSYSYKVTDSASTPVSVCSAGNAVTVNPALTAGSITPSNPSIDTGQSVTLISHASGGAAPLSFQWFTGGTCTSAITGATSPGYLASPTAASTYSYMATDSANTPVSRCSPAVTVTVNSVLVVSAMSPPNPTIDKGQSITLTSSVAGGTPQYSYQWYSDGSCGNQISGANLPTFVASPVSTTVYSYKVTDSAFSPQQQCSPANTVAVNPTLSTGPISPTTPTIDKGQLVLLTSQASGGTPSLFYQWYAGPSCANPIGGATSSSYLASPPATTTYSYSATDSAYSPATHCSSSDLVTVNPALQAGAITPSAPTIDDGQSVTLTAVPVGGTAPYFFQWYSGDTPACSSDTTLLGTSSTQVVSPNTSTFYCYLTSDSSNGLPAINATSPTDHVTVNSALTLPTITGISPINSGQSTVVTITWSGGTLPYTVTLFTSTSSSSCTGLVQLAQNAAVASLTSAFTESPTSTADYCAAVTDGVSSHAQTPIPFTVSVNPALTVNTPSIAPPTIDIGQASTVSATFSGGTPSFTCQWLEKAPGASSYNDLGSASSCTSPATVSTGVLATVGAWSFALQVSDSSGTPQPVVSSAAILTVQPPPGPLGISLGSTTIDSGQSSQLTTVSSFTGGTSPYKCQWLERGPAAGSYSNLGTNFTCSAGDKPSTSTGSLTTTGTWSFELQVTDSATPPGVSTSNTVSLTVNPPLVAGSIAPSSPSIDNGQSITLAANPSGGTLPYTYHWYAGTTLSCSSSSTPLGTLPTQVVNPAATTTYCYTVTDSAFNPVTKTSTLDSVSVNSPLVAGAITPVSPTIDNGQSITLNANPSGGTGPYSYQWFSGTTPTCSTETTLLGTSPSQQVSPTSSTYFCYQVTDGSSGLPVGQASSNVNLVPVNPALTASGITPASPTIDSGQQITLTAHPTGGTAPYSYEWFAGSSADCALDTTLIGTASTVAQTPSSNTYYCYSVTDSSSGNPIASATSATSLVTVNPSLAVSAPTTTPSAIDSGQSSSLAATITGGTSPYNCQWLVEGPGASTFADLSSSQTCALQVSTSTGPLSSPGTWSFELQVMDNAQSTVTSAATTITVNPSLSPPSVTASLNSVNLGTSVALSTASSFNGGSAVYTCQWLIEDPLHASFANLGASFSCAAGDKPSLNTSSLTTAGVWRFELQVTDSGSPSETASSASAVVTAKRATPTITAALSATGITMGSSVTDSATLTSGFQAGGTVTYFYFSDPTCTGSSTTVGSPVSVTNGSVPTSGSQTFTSAGSYSWNVSYSGDTNNAPAGGKCQPLSVFAPPTLTVPGAQTVTAGSAISFVVNATGAEGCNGVTLSVDPTSLPDGASFGSSQCFAGATSSLFSWTPSDSQAPGDYKVTFKASDSHGSVTASQVTIHVNAPNKAAPLPLLSYSIFGLVGFLAVIGIAILLRRFQTPRKKLAN